MLTKYKTLSPGNNRVWIATLFIILTTLLVTPVLFSSYRFESWKLIAEFAFSTIIIATFLTALRQASIYLWILRPVFWVLLTLLYTVRLTWFLVVDFSGEGFTNNFYAHISEEAARVAFTEYADTLFLAFIILTLACVGIVLLKNKVLVGPRLAFTIILVTLLTFFSIPSNSLEQRLLSNYIQFYEAMKPGQLNAEGLFKLQQTRLVNLDNNKKSTIVATAGGSKQNLILVYLESFHLAFTDVGPFPDLTPNINRLKRDYWHHSNWLSSADATMEAIISTQCGTLVSTPQGSNTFANTETILPKLACLPDVLRSAGYHQIFLGGFDKSFSGKNLFLTEHSYDEVFGWEDWQKLGFKNNDGYWGLPDDQLFEQALKRVDELTSSDSNQPYNLTLLTLSTHPPGFSSSSCTPYVSNPNGSRLLEAIHCTDQLVGKFVNQLQSNQLLENTTLVITGDHDIFNLPEVREHFPDLATDPRLLNLIIDTDLPLLPTEQLNVAYDLAPTLLDLLQVEHNSDFIWGNSIFEKRQYHVSRRFRGSNAKNLDFQLTADRDCKQFESPLTVPLDACEHNMLLNLSDRYQYSFYDQTVVHTSLCDAEHELQIDVQADETPISINFLGADLAHSFAYNGRPLDPSNTGFYLFVNASNSRKATYYYYGLDHIYWQMQLVDTLMELNAEDQFVLVYKPQENIEVIKPLQRLMLDYGFSEQTLDKPFILVTNGDPASNQIFSSSANTAASLTMTSEDCNIVAQTDADNSVLDRTIIDALLTPLMNEFPDI